MQLQQGGETCSAQASKILHSKVLYYIGGGKQVLYMHFCDCNITCYDTIMIHFKFRIGKENVATERLVMEDTTQ